MCMQQVCNRSGRSVRFCFFTILSALLVITTVSCRKTSPPGGVAASMSSTAGLVSDQTLYHVEVSDLGKIVLQLAKSVQEVATTRPDSQQNFKTLVQFLQEKLGINPLLLDEYQKLGIDLTKPVGLSLVPNHGIEGFAGDEVHGAFHVAVTDPRKVVDLFNRLLVDEDVSLNKLDGNGGMLYTVKDKRNDVMGLVFHHGYVSIILADVRDDDALRNYLPRFVAAAGKKNLQENKQYQRASENVSSEGLARMFVNLQVAGDMFEEEVRESIPLLQEFLGLGVSLGAKEARASLQMTTDSGLLKLIKPGASCQDLLARAEAPMVGFSLSLADPLAVVEYVIRHVQEDAARGDREVNDFKGDIEELEVSYAQVRKSLTPASAAVLLYPEFIRSLFNLPEVIGVLKLQEQGVAQQLLTLASEVGEKETRGQSTLYVIEPFIVGLVDGYVVAGTAMDKIRAIAADEAGSWKPFIGSSHLFAAELDVLAITQAVIAQQEMPQLVQLSVNSIMKKMMKSRSPLQLKTERLKDGAAASLDLGSFQIDRHILKLLAKPIHEMLEEMSEEIEREQFREPEQAGENTSAAEADFE